MQETVSAGPSLTTEEAKQKVFDHWDQIQALSRRRFPKSENLAEEALEYLLVHLQANNWRRIRMWQGVGEFLPFITTLALRLLTDFGREKFGYVRKPTWLANKSDALWDTAYRLIIIQDYERQEAIEFMATQHPARERWFIEEVVSTVLTRCSKRPRFKEPIAPLAHVQAKKMAPGWTPEEQLVAQDKERLEALLEYLQTGTQATQALPERVQELLNRLAMHLRLTEEDRLLLRLRYVDGLSMPAIVKLLDLKGDPYKRFNKMITQLQNACRLAGLL